MFRKKLLVGTKLDTEDLLGETYFHECPQCDSPSILRIGSLEDELKYQCLDCGFSYRFEFLNETENGVPEISRIVERKGYGVAKFGSLGHEVQVEIFNEPVTIDHMLGLMNSIRLSLGRGRYVITRWNERLKKCETILSTESDAFPFWDRFSFT